MKNYIEKMRRSFSRQTLCVNRTVVTVCAILCACIGLVFAIGGVDREICGEIAQPKFYFPVVIMIAMHMIFYALLGAAGGIIVCTPYYRRGYDKAISLVISLCTLFLCFTWIPLVYTAQSFFIAFIVCVIILLFSAAVFKMYIKINSVAAFFLVIFAFFDFYLLCYSLSLFILN